MCEKPKIEETISNQDRHAFELAEFKLLREEINYYNEAAFRTEVYVITGCMFIWGWTVFKRADINPDDFKYIAASPLFLWFLGFVRNSAIASRIKRLAFYIYSIEFKYFRSRGPTGGWEHFVNANRGNKPLGGEEEKTGKMYWARQAARSREFKYRFGVFVRSANRTWIALLGANLAAYLYLTGYIEYLKFWN